MPTRQARDTVAAKGRQPRLIKPNRDNIAAYGHAPLMQIMIAIALEGTTITYGDAKRRLEAAGGFSNIFSIEMGSAIGTLMNRVLALRPDAPLLNVLMVAQRDGLPSEGAGGFMAERFDHPELEAEDAKERLPDLWQECFDDASSECYSATETYWADLYTAVFSTSFPKKKIAAERTARQTSTERDGIEYGRHGEGPHHKALRLWVRDNPAAVRKRIAVTRAATEVLLDSADRVDAVYYCDDRIVVLEVKSRDSNVNDLRRGVYQCIKYRAVQEAMHASGDALVEAVLVTEMKIPGEIADLLKRHEIAHYQAPLIRRG